MLDYLPGINNTTLLVSVRAASYQANQVKQNVTSKLEDAIRSSDGLMDVETSSYDGGLLMNLYYPMDFNMKQAENEIKQALTSVDLPSDVGEPVVTRVTTSSFPILSYSITSNNSKIDDTALRSTMAADMAKQLKSVSGVADVHVTGTANNGFVLKVRAQDLTKNGLTLDDLNQSLAAALPNWSIGKVSNDKDSFPLTVNGWNLTDQELSNIPIENKQGISVPLSSVADLSHSLTDVKTVSRTNGKASVLLDVLKTPSSNITDVAKHVKDRIQQIAPIKNGDVSLTTMLDREHELNASLLGLVREGLLGCVFSILCVFFFFRNVRSTLLIAVTNGTPKYAITLDRNKIEQAGVKVEDVTKVIGQYMAGGKDFNIQVENERQQVQEHLNRCSECSAILSDLMDIKNQVFTTFHSIDTPETLEDTVLQAINSGASLNSSRQRYWQFVTLLSPLLFFAVAFALMGSFVFKITSVGFKLIINLIYAIGSILGSDPYVIAGLIGFSLLLIIGSSISLKLLLKTKAM